MYGRALAASAVGHHLGLLPGGLGPAPHGTRWADWLDLLVPWLVLTPAALTMYAARSVPWQWAVFGAGATAYTSGHGIHLAANSVGNIDPGPTAHLWDEAVGHDVWFAGVALVIAALASTMAGRPHARWWGHLLAIAVGVTWATNAVGGDTVVFSLVVALAAATFGWRHRSDLRAVLLVGFVPAVVFLIGETGAAIVR